MAISDVIPEMAWLEEGGNEASLENSGEDELRIFTVFVNQRTGKYRLAQADAVFVDNVALNATFSEVISQMIKSAKEAGEKILKKDIKM
jgi:hypothetical protein